LSSGEDTVRHSTLGYNLPISRKYNGSFYVTLPSDSSSYYFPANTFAEFGTKLDTPLELEHDKWEVGLVEISYPKGYKKRFLHNTLRFDSEEFKFPVKHYESVFDLTNIPRFYEPSMNESFIIIFSNYINKYEGQSKEMYNSCRGENSVMVIENLVSYFPARTYNGINNLAEAIINPANCRSSTVKLSTKDNFNFPKPEPVYVYTDIIKPNLVGVSYVRLLTSLHFPSNTVYHRFDHPLYKPVEHSFIESISVRLVMKTGENVLFEESDIPCLVILHFKKKSSVK